MKKHEEYMAVAIELAKQCPPFPFGAVVVDRTTGTIFAKGICSKDTKQAKSRINYRCE